MKLKAAITLSKDGRSTPISSGYKPRVETHCGTADCRVQLLGRTMLRPGERSDVEIVVIGANWRKIGKNTPIKLIEGNREVATGTVERLMS